ncbi:TrbI/VirB10 family protein [Sphingomonas soli]|uniref:TrbI/VirB10 family protein n=1 Tax=Sphingomonas soli TaxID=266127 RepID=UPI00082FCDA0|nr:TrbI/VirB10 family protein [Sphingomonas soli]
MTASAEPSIGAADLRLRGDPPRVMRLSRKALATVGLVATAGIGGALIYALQPSAPKGQTELYATDNRATSDNLAGAPKDYSQVPKLGPPLPGDLGRPILSAQQRGVDVSPPPMGAPVPAAGADAAHAARDRVRQERDAARTSKVFAGGESTAASMSVAGAPSLSAPAPAGAAAVPAAPGSTNAGTDQSGKRDFLRGSGNGPTQSSYRVAPASPHTVLAGSVIPAALITGIRSDLPGTITAQVTQNVYDSVSGRYLLIPQGSRLIGEYDSQVSFGQNRVLLAWDRLILPDGRSIQLDRVPGADVAGYSGLEDHVNQHWGGMLRAALISTLLSVGTEVGNSDDDDLVRALRQRSAQSIGRTGQDLVRRQMGVQPTLTIRPGFQLRVIVTRDIVFGSGDGGSK